MNWFDHYNTCFLVKSSYAILIKFGLGCIPSLCTKLVKMGTSPSLNNIMDRREMPVTFINVKVNVTFSLNEMVDQALFASA